jgi:uncharacterized membrane protein
MGYATLTRRRQFVVATTLGCIYAVCAATSPSPPNLAFFLTTLLLPPVALAFAYRRWPQFALYCAAIYAAGCGVHALFNGTADPTLANQLSTAALLSLTLAMLTGLATLVRGTFAKTGR